MDNFSDDLITNMSISYILDSSWILGVKGSRHLLNKYLNHNLLLNVQQNLVLEIG